MLDSSLFGLVQDVSGACWVQVSEISGIQSL